MKLLIFLLLSGCLAFAQSKDEAAILAGHEQARRAHLTGNADLLAAGIAEHFIEAGRGTVREKTREQMRKQFAEYFKVAKYSVWRDTYPPKVTISPDGKMAWLIVAVHGELTMNGKPQSFDSSWIATLEKIRAEWKMVGIASNVKED